MANFIGGTKGNKVTVNPDGSHTVTMTKLRKIVVETGIPSYQIGGMAGIHHYRMSLYMQGKAPISPDHLSALCKVLELPPEAITGEVDVRIEPNNS